MYLKNYLPLRVNERRYEFGDGDGADDWVCAKIPNDGRIKKDCVPKVSKTKKILVIRVDLILRCCLQMICFNELDKL